MACELTALHRVVAQLVQAHVRHSWAEGTEKRSADEFLMRATDEYKAEIRHLESVIDKLAEQSNGKA